MERKLMGTLSNYVEYLKNEYKVAKKVGNSRKFNRIIETVASFGMNTQLYSFMMSSLTNLDFEDVIFNNVGVSIKDNKNNKSLVIALLPNIKEVDTVVIEYKEDGLVSKKEFSFLDDSVCVKEFKEKGNIRIKTDRKYIDNRLVSEDVSRMKIYDRDNYYWVATNTDMNKNNSAIMREFIQVRKDGFVDNQFFRYYRGYVSGNAHYYTRSGSNIDYLYEYLEEDSCEIGYERYQEELSKIRNNDSQVYKYIHRRKED